MVVIVIIAILLTAVVTVGRSVVNKGQARGTEAMLKTVRQAVDQFQSDAPLQAVSQGKVKKLYYTNRYGNFPPDELELFTDVGLPGSEKPSSSIAPGFPNPTMVPEPAPGGYSEMLFYSEGLAEDELATEHRDLAAMLLAIRLYSDAASVILDKIPARYWSDGAVNAAGVPTQYLARDEDEEGDFGPKDVQIRYLVDAWGVPISYLAQRDWLEKPPKGLNNHSSSNHKNWNKASTQMIALNGGSPIIMSYGPNGREQLKKINVDRPNLSLLIDDWMDNQRIDNPLNDDNVYADPTLATALARGK